MVTRVTRVSQVTRIRRVTWVPWVIRLKCLYSILRRFRVV